MLALHAHKKKALPALASAVAILPVAIFATGNILENNNASALTYTIPDGYTTITDPVFYDCVVNNLGSAAASGPTDEQLASMTSLSCSGVNKTDKIENTTGLEKMAALTSLSLGYNNLSTIDVSSNTALISLSLYHNNLSTIDVSSNTALTSLSLGHNNLSTIDVSSNTALTYLGLSQNNLSTIDVSNNTALTSLDLYSNNLSAIDVSNNTALEYLYLSSNNLSAIDVSNNTALTSLDLYSNNLSAIDVSNNTALEYLYLYSNNLSAIDVSNNTALEILDLDSNNLSAIDVSNNIALVDLYLSNNAIFDFSSARDLNLDMDYSYFDNQSGTETTNTSTYVLPPLFTQVRDSEWDIMYTDQPFILTNATISDDGKSITITDLTQPATIKVQGGAADGSILTINYVAPQYTYSLSFDANGGTGAPEALTYGPTSDDSHTFVIPGTAPTRQGYTFLGWAEESNATSATIHAGDNITLSADKTLYAVWELEPEPDPEPTPTPDPEPEPEVLAPDTGFNTGDLGNNIGQSLIAILGALAAGISVSAYGVSRIIKRKKI